MATYYGETSFTMRYGHPTPQKEIEKEKQLMVRFRQYREWDKNGRSGAYDMYCRVVCSQSTRKLLLSGDTDAEVVKHIETEVVFGLFKTGLLLVGDNLCHTTFFFEEDKDFAETFYLHSIKI